MIKNITLVNNKVKQVDSKKIGKKFAWVRCINPSSENISKLSRLSKIPESELIESVQEEERPKLTAKKFIEIIYRCPYVKGEDIVTLPIYFYIYKNKIITIEKQKNQILESIEQNLDKKKFLLKKGSGNFVFHVLDAINDLFLEHIDKIAEGVEVFEQEKRFTQTGMENIYESSVALSYFNQALLANIEVLNTLRKCKHKIISKKDLELFSELYYDALHILDTETIQRNVITNLFNLQSIISSNKLNIFMKRLASLALIFMVPTLISAMYGMNFTYIPLKNHPYGFHITVMMCIAISAFLTVIFLIADWI
ncbi:MAG: Cobalt/magnesium transport protein CorA [Candidatus Woesearchaeota archaeon]|nr:Cobalt/magnesium transport protein CorA [Candidatus Woesearchaeota archaeon]